MFLMFWLKCDHEKGIGITRVNLEKQEKLNSKVQLKFCVFQSNWSLYTWLPCRHVYKPISHAGRQLSTTNGAIGRKD